MNDDRITSLKVPPHSIDAEQSLLGAVILQPELLLDIELSSDRFYQKEHRLIFDAIRGVFDRRDPVDALTVADELDRAGVFADAGGPDYLAEIIENTQSTVNAKHYAKIITDRATERRLISVANGIASNGYNGEEPASEKVLNAQRAMADLDTGITDEPSQVDSVLKAAIADLEFRHDNQGKLIGLPTGFKNIDSRTQGLRNGHLILIAGRPGMGKTTFAMNIAESAVLDGKFVIVFSLEMPAKDLMDKMICSLGHVDYGRYEKADLLNDEWDKVTATAVKLKGRSFYLDDKPRLTSGQLLSRARRISHRIGRKPDLVIVDYLQLLADKKEDKDGGVARITEISRNLKLAAKDLNCPLIALSQLNRNCESRPDKRPNPSDLRESGALEQDADLIYFMYRDEEYNENSQYAGVAEAICGKWRYGRKGKDYLSSARLDQCRFEMLPYGWEPPRDNVIPMRGSGKRSLDYAVGD